MNRLNPCTDKMQMIIQYNGQCTDTNTTPHPHLHPPQIKYRGLYKSSHKFEFKPDLLLHFIETLYTRREESNIFANPPAKWVSPLNIVEYPGVMGPCFVILYLFASKAITVNLVGKSY